jgi:hypothetical protein
MANISNISSLVSSGTLLKSAKSQLSSKGKEMLVQSKVVNKISLQYEIITLNDQKEVRKEEYKVLIQKIQKDNTLTPEEKNAKIDQKIKDRDDEIKIIDEQIKIIEQKITGLDEDPQKTAKEEKKKLNDKINTSIRKSRIEQTKSNRDRIKSTTKKLAPLMMGAFTTIIIKLITQNNRLQELVDKTNEVIDNATTPEQIFQAKILRDSAITILNNQERKIIQIKSVLERISRVIQIFTTILTIIERILSLPSPIPIPAALKVTVQPILQKLLKLLEDLNIILNIAIPVLDSVISNIESLKLQLRNINEKLDGKAEGNISIDIDTNIQGFNNLNQFNEYKGFKFALKEENNPKFVVRGNKRRYAVAINKSGAIVLNSDPSFTLDPNDLIEQLKLKIDQENLSS